MPVETVKRLGIERIAKRVFAETRTGMYVLPGNYSPDAMLQRIKEVGEINTEKWERVG